MESIKQLGHQVASGLGSEGFYFKNQFLTSTENGLLKSYAQSIYQLGGFKSAGIGKDGNYQHNEEVRSDSIYWINRDALPKELHFFYSRFDAFVEEINRSCYLGIVDSELHFAVYSRGSFYKKHVDVFQNTSSRRLSFICYLNEDWKKEDGGQLRLYTNAADEDQFIDIEPLGGRMIYFLSEKLPHEVLIAHQERWSITGWLKGPSQW